MEDAMKFAAACAKRSRSANFRAMAGRGPLLSSPFAADSRSLAALRIALGAIVVWEALWLLPRAGALLSSAGVLPLRALHVGWPAGTQFWSLNAASGGVALQWALLLLLAASGVSLALGHRPQASALCCWALYASLTNRNPMMAHGGDSLVRMELLLAAFAPLGECWTLEAPTTAATPRPRLRSTLGVAALMLQPMVMYHFAGALKFGATWRTERSAVYYALHVDMAVKAPAHRLRAQPALCRLASALTPLLEQWIAPLLLLCPLSAWRDRARLIAIGALAGLQLGFFGCMVLGNFPFISTAAILPFYPPAVWDALASATSPIRRLRPIWLRVHRAALAGWRAAGVQAPPAWDGTLGRASRALLVAIGVWVFLWNAASYCVNFKQFGALARPLPPSPRRPDLARPSTSPLVAGTDGVADLSTALRCAAPLGVPRLLLPLGEVLSLHQSWDLFAPDPNREDGYWVIAGQLEGGEMVDVAGGGGPLNFEKPALPSQFYGGSRWLQYYLRVWEEAREPVDQPQPTPLHRSAQPGRGSAGAQAGGDAEHRALLRAGTMALPALGGGPRRVVARRSSAAAARAHRTGICARADAAARRARAERRAAAGVGGAVWREAVGRGAGGRGGRPDGARRCAGGGRSGRRA